MLNDNTPIDNNINFAELTELQKQVKQCVFNRPQTREREQCDLIARYWDTLPDFSKGEKA